MAETLINQNQINPESWQKPSDWIDIRNGALPNSVYFLVGHSADYATYPEFAVYAEVSSSGTYDVFIDGIKQATTASGTATKFNWQTLSLTSGHNVTYPSALRTHIVRISPTNSSHTLKWVRHAQNTDTTKKEMGTLWVFFSLSNAISLQEFAHESDDKWKCPILEAVHSHEDEIQVQDAGSQLRHMFAESVSLKTIPTLKCLNDAVACNSIFLNCKKIKEITLLDFKMYGGGMFSGCESLERINGNSACSINGRCYENCAKLKNVLGANTVEYGYDELKKCVSLEPFVWEFQQSTTHRMSLGGSATYRIDGLKGLTVSASAPFDGTSPQIDVSYTGLDRAALVNLFNSMPTVSDSQVCNITGAMGAADLTDSDLAIATGKGWTITR